MSESWTSPDRKTVCSHAGQGLRRARVCSKPSTRTADSRGGAFRRRAGARCRRTCRTTQIRTDGTSDCDHHPWPYPHSSANELSRFPFDAFRPPGQQRGQSRIENTSESRQRRANPATPHSRLSLLCCSICGRSVATKSGREDSNLRPPAPKAGALSQAALRPEHVLSRTDRAARRPLC